MKRKCEKMCIVYSIMNSNLFTALTQINKQLKQIIIKNKNNWPVFVNTALVTFTFKTIIKSLK